MKSKEQDESIFARQQESCTGGTSEQSLERWEMLARPSREIACTETPVLSEDTKDFGDSHGSKSSLTPTTSSSTAFRGLVPGIADKVLVSSR